jgi:hypothetical protein
VAPARGGSSSDELGRKLVEVRRTRGRVRAGHGEARRDVPRETARVVDAVE